MIGLTTRNGKLETTGSRYSAEAVEREASLLADKDQASRAHTLMVAEHGTFKAACREAGYASKAEQLRRALGVETDRERVLQILRLSGVTYPGAAEQLADAWARELRADAGLTLLAAE